jgi:hypothetical protein
MYNFFQHFITDSISGLLVPLHIQKCMNDLDFENRSKSLYPNEHELGHGHTDTGMDMDMDMDIGH